MLVALSIQAELPRFGEASGLVSLPKHTTIVQPTSINLPGHLHQPLGANHLVVMHADALDLLIMHDLAAPAICATAASTGRQLSKPSPIPYTSRTHPLAQHVQHAYANHAVQCQQWQHHMADPQHAASTPVHTGPPYQAPHTPKPACMCSISVCMHGPCSQPAASHAHQSNQYLSISASVLQHQQFPNRARISSWMRDP